MGQHGVNIVEFTKQFNARTADKGDVIIPVVITVYADRSFSFITKTPPAAVLLKKACNLKSASAVPNKTKAVSYTHLTFGLTALIMAIIWAATSSASLGGMTILFGLMAAACGGRCV